MKIGRIKIRRIAFLLIGFIFCLALLSRPKNYHRENEVLEVARYSRRPSRMQRDSNQNFFPGLKILPRENWDVDFWQRANSDSASYKLLVFSAYYDGRTADKCVRVIGATITKRPPNIYCKLQFEENKTQTVKSSNKAINEHQNLMYSAFFFSCCFRTEAIPNSVSISDEENDFRYSAQIPVHHNQKLNDEYKGQFAVCVKPFHYQYDRATSLLEFLEYNRMMGVEQFFFYNHTVGPEVELVLRYYIESGLVTVLPWNLDLVSQKEIRTEGIFAALNDCLFRTMFYYKYVLMIDFDEFIVPRTRSNYSELIQDVLSSPLIVDRQIRSKFVPSCYIFKNVFFYLYWENDTASYGEVPEESTTHLPYLLSQFKTRRLVRATQRGRTKYIIHPEGVLEAGNHVIWRDIKDFASVRVEESKAILHHYRICEFGGFECLKQTSTVDRTAQRFSAALLSRILDQCRNIFPMLDGICPISPPLGSPW